MRILQQSPALRTAFQQKINAKKAARHEEIHQASGNSFLSALGSLTHEFNQAQNQLKGGAGEWFIYLILQSFSDDWIMFKNALIPANKSGNSTEIDHLIIGSRGVFLLEVKTWKGSFSACKDKWKRREGNIWVEISESPTSQSVYHKKAFSKWIVSVIPDFEEYFVYAPVVFPIAKWLGINNCSAPVFQDVSTLLKMITDCPECLTLKQVELIAEAIANCTIHENTNPISKPIKRQNPH